MSTDMNAIQDLIKDTRSKMRITKVVATRAVKTRKGDFFCGMSAAWDSTQDDAGGVPDADLTVDPGEITGSAMTLEEARVAQVLLNLEAAQGALRAALSDQAISLREYEYRVSTLKKNTLAHLSRLMPSDEAKKAVEAA